MSDFLFYLKLGFNHVIDYKGLDHFYFLIVLVLPYSFKEWKRIFIWVTVFTIGHSFSLLLSYYGVLKLNGRWVEMLIFLTIIYRSLVVLFNFSRKKKGVIFSIDVLLLTFIFGVVHGLGFGRYFRQIVWDEGALIALLSFAVGVELAQLFVVVVVLIVGFFVVCKISLKKTGMAVSSIVIYFVAVYYFIY